MLGAPGPSLLGTWESTNSMNSWTYIPICGVGGLFLALAIVHFRRRAAMRALAVRLGLGYFGGAFPRSLDFVGTPLEGITATWNLLDGELGNVRVVAFDCQVGAGKVSWRRTVIAVQIESDIFGLAPDFDTWMTAGRCGAWTVLYEPKDSISLGSDFMRIPELEARLTAINTENSRI